MLAHFYPDFRLELTGTLPTKDLKGNLSAEKLFLLENASITNHLDVLSGTKIVSTSLNLSGRMVFFLVFATIQESIL